MIAARPRFSRRWNARIDGAISALVPSPDGNRVAVATHEGPLAVFDARSGAQRWTASGHRDGTTALDWTPGCTRLISAGRDGRAIVHVGNDGTTAAEAVCGPAWVERIAVAPDGATFATACGREVALWTKSALRVTSWPLRRSTVLDLAWRPAAKRPTLACVAYGAVSLFDGRDATRQPRELSWAGSSLVLAWSPDGKHLATGDQDATVHFWVVRTATDLMMSGYERKVRELAWSPDSRWLATGGGSAVTVWDCAGAGPEGSEPLVLEHHESPLRALVFQRCGALLASSAADGSVAVWSIPNRGPRATLDGEGPAADVLRWSMDDETLFVGSAAGELTAWSQT